MVFVGRYLCLSVLGCGLVEVCVFMCGGWEVNWNGCNCIVCVFEYGFVCFVCISVCLYVYWYEEICVLVYISRGMCVCGVICVYVGFRSCVF